MKDDREGGDYEALSYIDEETARRAVQEAEEFASEVDTYIRKLSG